MMRTALATRYVAPLREGGSLPGLVEADDDGLYVLKFRGAGQGPRALIAELVAGEIGRALGLPVPELVFMELDPALGRNEPDYEIRSLILGSAGLNLAMDFLPGALPYSVASPFPIDADLASRIVWFDAYVTNIDRTPRNTNMLVWHHRLWLIDHGAALYFHHTWDGYQERARAPFAQIAQHALLPLATRLPEVDAPLRALLTRETLASIVALIPDAWLGDEPRFASAEEQRAAYLDYLLARRDASAAFVEEAEHARAQLV
ncbi:MAG: aminotransferase class I and II [Chloroflexota bacterium]|nr:aminotransferase class I and II [Chloroflexota bacterium]